ncbi:hypothetical protein B0H14DRAFT_3897302 [Mycena olivaceomarginata]|nr:hypothetical protein B0H14DRAFT_3897302 [Mycena olivaceomarginata]
MHPIGKSLTFSERRLKTVFDVEEYRTSLKGGTWYVGTTAPQADASELAPIKPDFWLSCEPLFESNYFQTVRRGASEAEIPDLILRVPVSEVLHINAAADVTLDFGPLPDHGIGARSSPLLAPLSFRPFLDVGIDLGHVLDALHGITNFDAIFRALAAGPFRSCFTGIYVRFCSPSFDSANLRRNMIGCWYLNAVSSGAPACSSVYPLRQLGELFFLADQDEGPFDFRHFEPGGR